MKEQIAELEKNKNVAGLEELKMGAEGSYDVDTANLAEQAIARLKLELSEKVEENTKPVETTEGQKNQIAKLEGNESDLQNATKPIDEKIASKDEEIKNVQNETEHAVNEIKNQTTEKVEVKNEVSAENFNETKDNLEIETYEKNIKVLEGQLETLEKWEKYFENNPLGKEVVSKSPTSGRVNFEERTQKLRTTLQDYIPLMQKYRNPELRDESQKDTKYQGLQTEIYNQRIQLEGQQDPKVEINWNSTSEGRIAYAEVYIDNLPVINSDESMPLSKLIKLSLEDKKKQIEINQKNLDQEKVVSPENEAETKFTSMQEKAEKENLNKTNELKQEELDSFKKAYANTESKNKLLKVLATEGISGQNSGNMPIETAIKIREAGVITEEEFGNGILQSLNNQFASPKVGGDLDKLADSFSTGYLRVLDSNVIKFLTQDSNIKNLVDKAYEKAKKEVDAASPQKTYYKSLMDKIDSAR